MGILISHYKDPYKPTSIMESSKFFFSWLNSGFGSIVVCLDELFEVYLAGN